MDGVLSLSITINIKQEDCNISLLVKFAAEVGLDIFNSFYKFTIVRNPWDRIVSQFAYMQTRPDLMDFIGMQARNRIQDLFRLNSKRNSTYNGCLRLISSWIKMEHLLVDKIGYLESIEKDSSEIFDILGASGEQK